MPAVEKEISKFEKQSQKIESFGDLLDSIGTIESKKKFLWKQIYENAIQDREIAAEMYIEAKLQIDGASQLHPILGPVLVKYIERMSRSNDQIIKLAELLSEEIEKNETMMPDEVYSQITKQQR